MNTIFEFLQSILPELITGICTFLITKYTYSKDVPLDKFEISYNRVYYPLYKLVKDESVTDDIFINKAKKYFDKYNKYIDRSTIIAFKNLCDSNTKEKKKDAYENLKCNILFKHSFLRRRLGYLEPNILQIYMYLSKPEKSTLRIGIYLITMYIMAVISTVFLNKFQKIFMFIIALLFIIMICDLIGKLKTFLWYKFRK